jgi:branched-chain amino acid transport system ATP-binding protein
VALEITDITKQFRGVTALRGVSLRLEKGAILGLIGPNGSGKTTLLNVASGVLRPTAGRVEIDGVDATRRPPHAFARLGVGRTFQQIRLFAGMSLQENVLVGALARGADRDTTALIGEMQLAEDQERDATTLSYGQQRRVEIARALAGAPQYLLLDEPAAGMNERESDDLLHAIRRIRDERGCGVLIVDHDLRLMMRLCDRIHVLAEGTTIFEGPPDEVRRSDAVIAAYLGSETHEGTHSPTAETGGGPEEGTR